MAGLLGRVVRRVEIGALAVLVALVAMVVPASAGPPPDALSRRTTTELERFIAWLEREGVDGYVGEVGWPGDPRWNDVAERWFRLADRAGLWTTAWLTTEGWGTAHPLSPYASASPARPITTRLAGAAVLEAHPSTARYRRGVNFSGGEHGFPHVEHRSVLSNRHPGDLGRHYTYGSEASFAFLAGRGVDLVRLPFRWERVQPVLFGPLDAGAVRELVDAVGRIRRHGMDVVLDLHNFGGYYAHDRATGGGRRLVLGRAGLPVGALADAWARLAVALRGTPGIAAYDLMNEPTELGRDGASVWEAASRRAVRAIRATGDARLVMVAGYGWSALHAWPETHPAAWIDDPAGNIRYEAHHYWDRHHSSRYASYDDELASADRSNDR